MDIRSNRSYSILNNDDVASSRLSTIGDFCAVLQSRLVRRVTLWTHNEYRSKVLSSRGSQFVVYTGDGVESRGQPRVVVKCAKVRLAADNLTPNKGHDKGHDKERGRVASSLYREIIVLTHPQLQQHANIISLLWYDFVEEEPGSFVPALIVERAEFGSLASFLNDQGSTLAEGAKVRLSIGVAAGLLALHRASIVHGDVKSENVLVCGADNEGDASGFTPKLADFGLSIFTAQDTELPRYTGTALTNAPEVSEQTEKKRLDALGLVRCDAYSLGLLIFEVVAGSLPEEMTAKDASVMPYARKALASTGISAESHDIFDSVFQSLLPYDAAVRCADLRSVISTLQRAQVDLQTRFPVSVEAVEQERQLVQNFGDASYFDFIIDEELEAERDVQLMVRSDFEKNSRSPDSKTAGKALFQLALASSIGFGTPHSVDKSLHYALQSAKKGYLPAMAVVIPWYRIHDRKPPVSVVIQIDWLFEATAWGSMVAGSCLRSLDPSEYTDARTAFHRSGGYNQYYYARDAPAHVLSPGFIQSAISLSSDELAELAQLAAVYGACELMTHLLHICGVDANLTNQWGESLLVLCCKGGHLDVLKVREPYLSWFRPMGSNPLTRQKILIECGAVIVESKGLPVQGSGSPVHWLIAFEDDQIKEAASLLALASKGFGHNAHMTWNHPSIDLPGRFPLGTPLHYAAFTNSAACVEAAIDVLKIRPNWSGGSELTPFELGFSRRKLQFSRAMVAKGCLKDASENTGVLLEFAGLLRYESWTAAAADQLPLAAHVGACLDLVLKARPEYLDDGYHGGFTPLMQAVTYHDRLTVKALIDRGCDANAKSWRETGGRTALTFLTTTKVQHEPDDIIDLLLGANADIHYRSRDGDKQPLHYAVRDDCPFTTRKLIENGADVQVESPLIGTPLHLAVLYGSTETARVLLEKGADANAEYPLGSAHSRSWDKITPLAIAATRLRQPLVELLLEYGAGFIARPVSGHSMLHLAVAEREPAMLQMLLRMPEFQKTEVLDHQTKRGGVTAIVLASANPGRHEHLALLLKAGADPNVKTNSGHTALDVALDYTQSLRAWLQDILRCRREGDTKRLSELRKEACDMLGAASSHLLTTKAIIHGPDDEGPATEEDAITITRAWSPRTSEDPEESADDSGDEAMEIDEDYQHNVEFERGSEPRVWVSGPGDENNNRGVGCETTYLDVQAELVLWESSIEMLEMSGAQRSSTEPFDRYIAGSVEWRPEAAFGM